MSSACARLRLPDTALHITLLVARLTVGGAEAQARLLERGLRERGHRVTLLTIYPGGDLAPDPEEGIEHEWLCQELPRKLGMYLPRAGAALTAWLRRVQPDVLYSLDLPSNMFAARAGAAAGVPVAWGIRNSGVGLGWKLRVFAWVGARRRKQPKLCICNSRAGRRRYAEMGYLPDRVEVIVNGVDTTRFDRNPQLRSKVRADWGIGPTEVAVGLVARMDPIKGHAVLLQAARLCAREHPGLRYVFFTPQRPAWPDDVERLMNDPDVARIVHWVTAPDGMVEYFPGLDALVSCSHAEAFSNAIVEAMACAIPAIVTDVGDSAWIVGDTGRVVAVNDPEDLASALGEVARESDAERTSRGDAARERVQREMGLEALFARTEAALKSIV